MSRNLRRKFPATGKQPVKQRRPPSPKKVESSGDEGYSAVEDISESDDDDNETDVEAAEAEHIKSELRTTLKIKTLAPRPVSSSSDEDEDAEDEDDGDDDDEVDDEDDLDLDGNGEWDGIMSLSEQADYSSSNSPGDGEASSAVATTIERHVRFAGIPDDPDSTDSDATEDENYGDLFPDIFIDKNALDPGFARKIEFGDAPSASYYDDPYLYPAGTASDSEVDLVCAQDDDTPTATPVTSQPISDPFASSSDYDSDGDTTEEDEPVLCSERDMALNESASDSEYGKSARTQRGKPRVGSFKLDRADRKPIAVLNPVSKKMMIFCHHSADLSLSPEQFRGMPEIKGYMDVQSSPIVNRRIGVGADMMFGAVLFGTASIDGEQGTQFMGPAEAFYPSPIGLMDNDQVSTSSGDSFEDKIDISSFIHYGEDSSDEEEAGQESDSLDETPVRPSTASSDLGHLNSMNVGLFRRNQINQQLINSEQATAESLEFSRPYHHTTLKGIKTNCLESATVPLTPITRHRRKLSDQSRSPTESLAQKRKASGDVLQGHKRHRSISDVNTLRI